MAYFDKEFKFVKEENFDDFVASLKVGSDVEAKAILEYRPPQKVVKDGDGYKLIFITPNGNREISFKNGVAFEESLREDLKAKTIFNINGDTFVQVQEFGDKGVVTTKREYSENELKVTVTQSNWNGEAYRWYKA